jgi:hypothetical protein
LRDEPKWRSLRVKSTAIWGMLVQINVKQVLIALDLSTPEGVTLLCRSPVDALRPINDNG